VGGRVVLPPWDTTKAINATAPARKTIEVWTFDNDEEAETVTGLAQ